MKEKKGEGANVPAMQQAGAATQETGAGTAGKNEPPQPFSDPKPDPKADKAQGTAGNYNKHLVPTMGRIVRVNEAGGEGEDNVQYPAIITAADPATNRISVTVFRESWVDHIQNLPLGTGPKTWSWPPRD